MHHPNSKAGNCDAIAVDVETRLGRDPQHDRVPHSPSSRTSEEQDEDVVSKSSGLMVTTDDKLGVVVMVVFVWWSLVRVAGSWGQFIYSLLRLRGEKERVMASQKLFDVHGWILPSQCLFLCVCANMKEG